MNPDRIKRIKQLRATLKELQTAEETPGPPDCAALFAAKEQLEAALQDVNELIFINCTA